ncbi:MAG: hypothetical protein GXP14_04805 [Gammaproteobacteria bacterium]|nr:hypothetical protein [Gammaproteobacteria bacterium]
MPPQKPHRFYFFLKVTLILILLPNFAWSFSSISRDFNELVSLADTIIIGTVSKQQSNWTDPVAQNFIHTAITLENIETLKGEIDSETYELIIAGGTIPPFTLKIPGAPSFSINKRYILFIKNNHKSLFPLVGVHDGIFVIETATNGETNIKNIEGALVTAINQNKVLTQTATNKSLANAHSISLNAFRQEIMLRLNASGEIYEE